MYILAPLVIYLLLYIPYLFVIPLHDGLTEFIIANNLYTGHYLTNWMSFHPPVKLLLSSLFFYLFGYFSYSTSGLLIGELGIAALYYTAERLFDKKTALLASIMLSCSGLYISVGLFSITDFVMTVCILIAFYLYIRSKFLVYAIMASAAVLTKETAIFFPLSILLVDILQKKKQALYSAIPILSFGLWILFVYGTGHHLWNDWNFSATAKKGSMYTMINNLLTLHFLNKYAYENWRHLFLFNFNWCYWILALIGIHRLKMTKYLTIIIVFSVIYSVTVLSFQTFTITRYILPILPFLYIFTSNSLCNIKPAIVSYVLQALVGFIIVLSLFTSNDPVSNMLWTKNTESGQSLYVSKLGAWDAMEYNMQYLFLAEDRTEILLSGNCSISHKGMDYNRSVLPLFGVKLCKN